MARAEDEANEELQGMLSAPPPKTARRWPWVVLAMAVVGVVGARMSQLASFDNRSVLDHVTLAHGTIGAIIAAATEKSEYDESVELLIDSHEAKGSPPEAMGIKAVLKQGGEGKWPIIKETWIAKEGKATQLKEKLEGVIAAMVAMEAEHNKKSAEEMKKAITAEVNEKKDAVVVTVVPPKEIVKKEDARLKDALKKHKPEFTAEAKLGASIADFVEDKKSNAILSMRGIEAKIGAVFADSLIEAVSKMPGLPPPARALVGLFRSTKLRNELYYDEDKLVQTHMVPPTKHVLPKLCSGLPPNVAKASKGLADLTDGISEVLFEGLPYDWELKVSFKDFDPSPIIAYCTE